MAAVTVRNLPEETHRALKRRAALKGTSTEAEIRAILEAAVLPDSRLKLGSLKLGSELAAFGKKFGGLDLNISRDPKPSDPAQFE